MAAWSRLALTLTFSTGHANTKFSAQRFLCPRETKSRAKKQSQEIEDEREGEGNKGEGAGIFVPEEDKGRPLDREETDMAHGKMVVYKGKGGNPMLG